MKTTKQLERYFKGTSNHWRIEILLYIEKNDGVTLEKLSKELECHFKTLSEHTRKLVNAGLVNKNYHGREVAHSLSPYGKRFCNFIRSFN